MGGVALYAKETDLTGEHLRLLSTDELGALNINSYAPIISRTVPLSQTDAGTYLVGKVIGTPSNPAILNSVSRANGHGAVIETLTFRILGTDATPPDLDIYVFGKEFGVGSTIANNAYPVIDQDDWAGLNGVIQIRAASGHWTQMRSSAGVVMGSCATLTPFLSIVLANTDPASSACYMVTTMASATYTFAAGSVCDYKLSIRQG